MLTNTFRKTFEEKTNLSNDKKNQIERTTSREEIKEIHPTPQFDLE